MDPHVKKWIFDSGCGVDLVSKKDIKGFEHKIRDADEPLVFRTANGRTEAESTIKIPCKEIGCSVNAYVLQNTPAVVSMGKRCMEEGCSFVCPSGESPFLVDPKGRITLFEVRDNIPYIVTGSDTCRRRKIKKRVRVPLVQDCAPNEEENPSSESESPSEEVSIADEDEQSEERENVEVLSSNNTEPDRAQGCSTKGHRRNRKDEAKSMLHACTHKPYNPHCDVCRRSKARGALNRLKDKYNPKRWGQLITADHMGRSARADVDFWWR